MKKHTKFKKFLRFSLCIVSVLTLGIFAVSVQNTASAETSDETNRAWEFTGNTQVFTAAIRDQAESRAYLQSSNNTENASYEFNFTSFLNVEYNYVIFRRDAGESYCSVYFSKYNYVSNDYSNTTELYDATEDEFVYDQYSEILIRIYPGRQIIVNGLKERFFDNIYNYYIPGSNDRLIQLEPIYKVSGWYSFNSVLNLPAMQDATPLTFEAELRYLYDANGEYVSTVSGILAEQNDILINLKNGQYYYSIFDENNVIINDFRVLLFETQYLDANTYSYLIQVGSFRYVEDLNEGNYTITDLLMGIVDIPFHYLSQYMDISLFNTSIFAIFCTFITIALAVYVVKVFK